MADDINMLALAKGEEKYVFLFDDKNRSETLRQLGKYASDPDLSFTWYDAAVLSQKIRTVSEENNSRFDTNAIVEAADSNDPEDLFH